ncbi:type II secretion system F family protein [Agromyces binzhouensis]|uniref:type II secretion system F family protein n=1 Tax=Agromyces binzhouensis TaxID=1817495 RepID=UPI0036399CAE
MNAIGLVAALTVGISIGLVAWFLIGAGRARTAETGVEESAATAVQRTSFSESLVKAAPKGYIGWLERQITYAARPAGWSITRIFVWKTILVSTAFVLGWLFIASDPAPIRVILVIAAFVLGFFLPDVLINSRAHDRQTAIQRALPDTLDQMTIAVEAGLGFDAAMAKAGRNGRGPMAEELIRTLQDMSIGRTRRDAYAALEQRTNSEDLRRFVRAVQQADAYGVAIADVLRVQAGEMRVKRRQRAEEQAMKIPVKIVFPLVFCILPVLFIVILTPAVIGMMAAFG